MSETRKHRSFMPEQKIEIVLAGLRGDRRGPGVALHGPKVTGGRSIERRVPVGRGARNGGCSAHRSGAGHPRRIRPIFRSTVSMGRSSDQTDAQVVLPPASASADRLERQRHHCPRHHQLSPAALQGEAR